MYHAYNVHRSRLRRAHDHLRRLSYFAVTGMISSRHMAHHSPQPRYGSVVLFLVIFDRTDATMHFVHISLNIEQMAAIAASLKKLQSGASTVVE